MFNIPGIFKVLDRIKQASIKFDASVCVRYRDKSATCRRCEDICPENAINWENDEVFDPYACTSCGLCAAICPVSALSVLEYRHDLLHMELMEAIGRSGAGTEGEAVLSETAVSTNASPRHLSSGKNVLISCPKDNDRYSVEIFDNTRGLSGATTLSIKIRCLGALTAYDLVDLIFNSDSQIFIGSAACGECSYVKGFHSMTDDLAAVEASFAALALGEGPRHPGDLQPTDGISSKPVSTLRVRLLNENDLAKPHLRTQKVIEIGRAKTKDKHGLSRREFFTGLKKDAVYNAGRAVTEAVLSISEDRLKDVRYNNRMPEDKRKMIEMIIGRRDPTVIDEKLICQALFELGFKSVSANGDCDLCLTCGELCPTSALVYSYGETQNENILRVISSLCVGCGLCKDVCPKNAIVYQPADSLTDMVQEKEVRIAKEFGSKLKET